MKQTVLITGTSSGIGKATAKFFHNKGWNVVATMRSPEKEEELHSLENVLVLRLDVTDTDSIGKSVNQAIEKFGKIDVVVNNAGYAVAGVFESASKESIDRQFAVNVTGLIDVTQAVLPHFRKNRSGVFVNISSMGGKVTFPLLPLYHATKFAVEGFSESLSYELAPFGVKLKIVEPGGVSTDFGTRSLDFQYQPGLAAEYDASVEKMQQFWTKPGACERKRHTRRGRRSHPYGGDGRDRPTEICFGQGCEENALGKGKHGRCRLYGNDSQDVLRQDPDRSAILVTKNLFLAGITPNPFLMFHQQRTHRHALLYFFTNKCLISPHRHTLPGNPRCLALLTLTAEILPESYPSFKAGKSFRLCRNIDIT